MARKHRRGPRGNAAEQETQRQLGEALRMQARMLAIIEQGERRRSRSRSRRTAGSLPRAVLTPRADVEANQKSTTAPPFPPQPHYLQSPQYWQPVPPPPPPPPEPAEERAFEEPAFQDGFSTEGAISAADARLVRVVAETLRVMGQEHVAVA